MEVPIVTVCFDVAAQIKDCIRSADDQTDLNVYLVIIDGFPVFTRRFWRGHYAGELAAITVAPRSRVDAVAP